AKAVQKSVSDFVKKNPNAVKASAVAVAAGICVAAAPKYKAYVRHQNIQAHRAERWAEARNDCWNKAAAPMRAKIWNDAVIAAKTPVKPTECVTQPTAPERAAVEAPAGKSETPAAQPEAPAAARPLSLSGIFKWSV